jgi:hypothetical protein
MIGLPVGTRPRTSQNQCFESTLAVSPIHDARFKFSVSHADCCCAFAPAAAQISFVRAGLRPISLFPNQGTGILNASYPLN